MSSEQHKPVEILPGVRHYSTSGFADTWEAYDALTAEDGWTERTRDDTTWKGGTVNCRKIVVFAPHEPRQGGGGV